MLAKKPPAPDHPRITISPHNAGLTEECTMWMADAAARNILDDFDGGLEQKLIVNAAHLMAG